MPACAAVPIVVVNAAEGEPASLKDRTLLEMLPHLVLDGGLLAAQAVGADEVIICVCDSAPASIEGIAAAIEERGRLPGAPTRMHLAAVPSHYVAGQESALVNYLNGGPAKPTFTPPMPFEQGVRRRPTLINNAETLAHIALIARHGSQWFRQLGTPSQPGSALITLSGPVVHPGVYEIEHGASLASLIEAAGGATGRLRGALLGGYAGTWIGGELLRGLALSDEHLAPHGASLGAGRRAAALRGRLPRGRDRPRRALARRPERPPVRTMSERARRPRDDRRGNRGRRRPGQVHPAHRPSGIARGAARRVWPSRRGRQTHLKRRGDVCRGLLRPRTAWTVRRMHATRRAAAEHASTRWRRLARADLDPVSHRVRVNPIACEAHGMCAELLPERITLDEWGYPIIDGKPVQAALLDHARRAAAACPTFALLLESERGRR